jgi:hypothetical protein
MMCRRLALAVLALALIPALAAAEPCSRPGLGLFVDEQATVCEAEPPLYAVTHVNVLLLPNGIPDPIGRVGFRLENIPDDGAGGIVTMEWRPGIVGQDPEEGMSILFTPAEDPDAPVIWLGRITLFPIVQDWLGDDYQIRVAEATLWDENEQAYGMLLGQVVFFPTWPPECFLTATPPPVVRATGFAPRTGDDVGDAIDLSFALDSWECLFGDPLDYAGQILVEGEQVAEFSGNGHGDHALVLDASGVPAGEPVTVELFADNEAGADTSCRLVYWKSDATGVPEQELSTATISALKALYR